MAAVIDTTALIAVLVGEAGRNALIAVTVGVELLAPASVHWEVGNALSALLKRKRVTLAQAQRALAAYAAIPIRFLEVDLVVALEIAAEQNLYAYDAYLLTCALAQRAPLLTLDHGLQRAATAAGVQLVEVSA